MEDKQMANESANLLRESIQHIKRSEFFFNSLLPLPSYLLSFIEVSDRNHAIAKFAIHLIITCLIINLIKKNQNIFHLIFYGSIFLSIVNSIFELENNNSISALFSVLLIKYMMLDKYWISSILLGLSVSSDLCCFALLIPFAIVRFINLFYFLLDISNKPLSMIKESIKTYLQVFCFPLLMFLSTFYLDIKIRNNFGKHADSFSFEFQVSLNNYTIPYSSDFKDFVLNETDEYLMDRSKISIFNKKHKIFIDYQKNKLDGSKESRQIFGIIKMYKKNFEEESKRLIKDGDYVKIFLTSNEEEFLGISETPKDEKFVEVTVGKFVDDNDIWIVECKGYLRARSSVFKLRHSKSGLYLGCRNFKTFAEVHGSVYSDNKSRLFYIIDNDNHFYFKKNFRISEPNLKIKNFKTVSTSEMILEYLQRLLSASIKKMSENIKLTFKYSSENQKVFYFLVATYISCMLAIAIFALKFIIDMRTYEKVQYSEDIYVSILLFVTISFSSFLIDSHSYLVFICGIYLNFNLLNFFFAGKRISLLKKQSGIDKE